MKNFLSRRLRSFSYATNGILYVLKSQPNTWIHAVATLLVINTAFLLQISAVEFAILILVIGLVWVTEFLNTSIEVVVNLVSPQHNPLAKAIKDISAGAVLIAAITSVITGILIILPPLIRLLGVKI